MNGDRAIENLREALRHSPENIPLRRHLAETLLGQGRPDQAEVEFREALSLAPDDSSLKFGLANSFHQQGKSSLASVLLEDLTRKADVPPRAFLLYARLLFQAGEVEEAVKQYRRGVADDPSVADPEFAGRLGIRDFEEEHDTEELEDEVVEGKVRASWGESSPDLEGEVERPSLRFADVGGMESVKDEIRIKIIHPMNHPDLYRAYGKSIGGGILLYGPPGCGKTYLARATAGEISASFISVGINDVLEMWIGNSERNLHALFEQARANAPCVLFFDEVDALAASRTDLKASGGRQLINQFLSELDGVGSQNEGVLILAATNAPWHLDPAFRRPGRFDRILFVPPPDAPARAAILRLLCRGKPVQDVDYDHLAKKSRELLGGRPPGRRRPGGRGQAPRGDEVGNPQTPGDQGLALGGLGRSGLRRASGSRRLATTPSIPTRPGSTTTSSNISKSHEPIPPAGDSSCSSRAAMNWPTASSARISPRPPITRSPTPSWRSAWSQGGQADEALREADEAVRCGPDVAFCHYVRGSRPPGHESAWPRPKPPPGRRSSSTPRMPITPPSWPPSRWSVATGKGRSKPPTEGSHSIPEHAGCLNLRAMALVQLGRKDEASRTLGSALADDPENALTHANQGWALLHRGRSWPGPHSISGRRSGSTPRWNGPRSGSSRRSRLGS